MLPVRLIGSSRASGVFIDRQPTGVADEQNAYVTRDSNLDGNLNCQRICKDKQSETFLKKAIEGNFAEVSMGELA